MRWGEFPSALRLQVQGHAELRGVEIGVELGAVGSGDVVLERSECPHEVEPSGRLDAHDGGAVVGEGLADHGPHADPAEVRDLEPGEGRRRRCPGAVWSRTGLRLGEFPEGRCPPSCDQRRTGQPGEGSRVRPSRDLRPECAGRELRVVEEVRDVVDGGETQSMPRTERLHLPLGLALDEYAARLGGGCDRLGLQAPFPDLGEPAVEIPATDALGDLFAVFLGPAHQLVQRPLAENGHLEAQDDMAVRARNDVGQLETRRDRCRPLSAVFARSGWIGTDIGRKTGRVHQRPHDGGLGGHVQVLAQTRGVPLVEGDGDVGGRLRPGVEGGLGHRPHGQGRAVGIALQPDQAAGGFHGQLRRRKIGGGAARSERGDRGVDDVREALGNALRAARFDEHVRVGEEGGRVRRHDAAFADPERGPVQGLVAGERRQRPALATAGRLDLDHLGAEFGEYAPGQFSPPGRGIDDADLRKRSSDGASPRAAHPNASRGERWPAGLLNPEAVLPRAMMFPHEATPRL